MKRAAYILWNGPWKDLCIQVKLYPREWPRQVYSWKSVL